ncbi:NYN domain-containing protein [Devosia riboflavina]
MFIDCDGVSPADADRAIKLIKQHRHIYLLRVYGNYTGGAASAWNGFIRRNGAVARHLPNLIQGKNAADIALTIDAVEVLLTSRISHFALIVSDTDFVPLAHRIRADGKNLFGFGQNSTPLAFREACNRFWELSWLRHQTPSKATKRAFWKLSPHDAELLVIMGLREAAPDGGSIPVDRLGQALVRQDPDFDPRVYSRQNLTDLLRDLSCVELIEGTKRHVRLLESKTRTG